MRYFSTPGATRKSDRSIVTKADIAIESYLRSVLGGSDVAILGEEETATDHAALVEHVQHGTAWVLDPIDGTAPYANQLPNWGISIGYLEHGRFSRGAIFLPSTGEVVVTEGDAVLYQRMSRDPASWRMDDLRPIEPRDMTYRSTGMITVPQSVHSREHPVVGHRRRGRAAARRRSYDRVSRRQRLGRARGGGSVGVGRRRGVVVVRARSDVHRARPGHVGVRARALRPPAVTRSVRRASTT